MRKAAVLSLLLAAVPRLVAAAVVPLPAPAPAVPASPTPAAPAAQFHDGSFTGSRFDATWGTVQVRATIQGGRLSTIDVLAYPSDRSTSRAINRYALPLLAREVVQAQGVAVNTVSGATLTTRAYLNSLRTALSQAH